MKPPLTQQSSRSPTRYNVFGSATGRDFINVACTSVKIAVFAPIPNAIVSTTVIAKPGDLRNCRNATQMSPMKSLHAHEFAHPRIRTPTNVLGTYADTAKIVQLRDHLFALRFCQPTQRSVSLPADASTTDQSVQRGATHARTHETTCSSCSLAPNPTSHPPPSTTHRRAS